MSFEVYTATNNVKVVSIEDNQIYIHPAFSKPLQKIRASDCLSTSSVPEIKKVFGKSKFLEITDEKYPQALKMYCLSKFLSHPESYVNHPIKVTTSYNEGLNTLNKA